MTVSLTGNFLATARCLIFEDATGVTWAFNSLTNQLTATVSASASANVAANLASGAAGDIPYQTGSGATSFLAPGSNGNLLTLSAGLPAWESVPTWNQNTTGTAAGLSTTLGVGSGGTGETTTITAFENLSPMTTTGDIIYAPGAGTATRLGIGTSGQVLTVGGGIPGWSTPAAVPAAANPTANVGATAVNGSATTWMRSDAAPPIDLTFTPTWTGAHTWTSTLAASGNPLTSTVTRAVTGLVGLKASPSTAANSTPATDAALTLTFNETGWYEFEIFLAFFEATSGAGGFQFNVNGGGSGGSANYRYTVEGFSTTALALIAGQTGNAAFSQAAISTSSTSPSWYRAKGVFQVTVAGTFGVQWAQASTLGVDPTTLMAGSFYEAIKIG